MPVMHCQINGKKGYKWGESGKCYPGESGKIEALKQGQAIHASRSDTVPFIFSSLDFQIQLIRQRREQLKQSGGRLPSPSKIPPRQATGKTLELSYFSAINKLVSPIKSVVKEVLFPRIPIIIQEFKRETKVDTYADLITETFNTIDIAFAGQFSEEDVKDVTEKTARNTSNFNKVQVDKQFISVLGVSPVRSEHWLNSQIDSFVQRNVSLIKSIPEEYFDKLETLVRTRIEEGVSTTKLKKEIFESFGKITNRSALIARDQINKFQGSLTKLRQTESGVTHYTWSTSKDERVRERHKRVDGEVVSWKSKGLRVGNKGEFYHPGFDYSCRCVPIPKFDNFFTSEEKKK
jgi:SPP1 gp7 family putative phage head morphogenesis protein